MNNFSIGNYVRAMFPVIDKSRIVDDITAIRKSLVENTIPPYTSVIETYGVDKFTAKSIKQLNDTFVKRVRLNRSFGKDYNTIILKCLNNVNVSLGMISDDIDKLFAKEVLSSGVTYARANILRYIETSNFYIKYARSLLVWTLNEEQRTIGKAIGDPFSKMELKWLIENRESFMIATKIVSMEPNQFIKLITSLPDIAVIPDEVDVVIATLGQDKVDPMRMGILPKGINVIFSLRKWIAEWQVSQYEVALEEAKMLELRLLQLKDTVKGQPNAKIEQEILYSENRLKKLKFKLAKIEEEAS